MTESGSEVVAAQIGEHEQRDSDPDKEFNWTVSSAFLSGHVQSITLVDSSAKGTVLYRIPVASDGQLNIANGYARQSGGANLDGLFDLLGSGRGIIIITSDLPGKETIEMLLTIRNKSDWNRPYCS